MNPIPVKMRLGIAFSLLLGLLVAMGWLALDRMGRVNDDMKHLVEHHWAKVQLSRQALANSTANNRLTLQIFLLNDRAEIEELLAQRAHNTETISGLVKEIERDMESPAEDGLLTAVKEARAAYVESYQRALTLLLEDQRPDEARACMVRVTLPLLIRYHAAWNAFVEYQGREMDRSAQEADARYVAMRRQMLVLILVAVGGAVAVMVRVTHRIGVEMAERQRAQEALRQAHQELEERIQQRTAELTAANNTMRAEIAERQKAEEGRWQAQQERDLIECQLRHSQKLEAIGQLAAGIAHEINTPMQYVGDNARFLQTSFESMQRVLAPHEEMIRAAKRNNLTPELVDRAEAAARASDLHYLSEQVPAAIVETLEGVGRIKKIVQAMKEFSHPGNKEKVATDLNRAIESTVIVARSEWKGVADLELNLDPTLPLVPCFQGEFNQCMLNLIVNAAHAIAEVAKGPTGPKGIIKVQTCRQGDHVEVRVSDTGPGIPEFARGKIFEPFFTTKAVGKGTGQGLTIVYGSIVKKHGGSVSFETVTGRGTTFIVRLPITVAATKAGPQATEAAKVPALETPMAQTLSAR